MHYCVRVINVYTCTLGPCIHNRVVKVLSIGTLYLIYYILYNALYYLFLETMHVSCL